MLPRPFRVVGHHLDTDDTVTLSLEPVDGMPLEFAAGQFTMLHAFGVGEVPISISGDPTWPGPLVHTIRDVGNVTHALVGSDVGSVVGVRGPYGRGWEVADGVGGDVLLAAGGIGLAPLRPVLWEIADRRADFDRVVLLYRHALAVRGPLRGRPRTLDAGVRDRGGGERRLRPADLAGPGGTGHETHQQGGVRPASHAGSGVRAGDHDDPEHAGAAVPGRGCRIVCVCPWNAT
jgi:hypothetical protein